MSNWQMATTELKVQGMTCNGCKAAVTNTLRSLPGVQDAEVDLQAGRASVTFDPARASVESMIAALGQLGYQAEVTV
jgi:copper chaperone